MDSQDVHPTLAPKGIEYPDRFAGQQNHRSMGDLAENGAAVSVILSTGLAQVRQMLVLVDKNPTPLAARFVLTDAVEPQFVTRIRMAETAQVYAVVILADGRVLFARKEVKVTLSGCGG